MKNGIAKILRAALATALLFTIMVSPASNTQAIAVGATDWKAPTAPLNLKVAAVGTASAKMIWSKSTDNVGVTSYVVYKNSKYSTFSTTTSSTVSGLSPNTPYTFYVKAQDKSGNFSATSNKVTVKTLPIKLSTIKRSTPMAKIIAGYYASWAAYSGYTPSDIPAANLTHINYAFANIGNDLKITMGDAQVDPQNFTALKALKKTYPRLKTLISVGGWTWSAKFSNMAYTDSRRSAFADSVVAFIKKYGFDGVDLDWEYRWEAARPAMWKEPWIRVTSPCC